MKKIICFTLSISALLVAVSCEKNLEIPQKGVVNPEEYYVSDAQAEALLANMYTSCFGGHGIAGSEGIYNNQLMVLNYSADDILAAGGHADDHLDFRIFDEFRYDNASGVLRNLYDGYALAISTANIIISNFTDENKDKTAPKFTSDYTKRAVAEARVFRAYMHLMEALIWNTPCISDRTYGYYERPLQAESQKQVLDWVIAECEKAISSGSLPVRKDINDKDATAIMTVGFAQFVAGKAAMFNNDPATTRKYLGALIQSGKYKLVDSQDYWTLFHAAGDGNSEVLFAPNFQEDPNLTSNGWGTGTPIQRGRWMIADVLCWRTDALASTPTVVATLPYAGGGWNGGAITEAFAKKFVEHDGKSPRRLATFLTEDEWLYEMDWSGSAVNNGSLADKKKDSKRGISSVTGVYSHGPYFEWKRMAYNNVPRLLAGEKASSLMADSFSLGPNSNQSNLCMARYAEALLLYAEACIGSSEKEAGLKALNEVQARSGSGKISSELSLKDIIEEKQYELWFEGCRFHDLVRWAKSGDVDLDEVFNKSQIHDKIPIVKDKFFTDGAAEHSLFVEYTKATFNPFVVGKNEYLPFPRDVKTVNPNIQDVLGWK